VKLLIDKGADVNVKNVGDRTPLMWAAMHGHTEVVRLLIDNGADVDAKCSYGGGNDSFEMGRKGRPP